jgi:EAL domain-containing protein (putative c-di-GMP-specific phosphodiesterase class I)
MDILKGMGCRFALDDFGNGMASFNYLKQLPVDFLKIDGGIVRNMLQDPVSRAMVESINQIGHIMGLKTIAEYVESKELLQSVRELGIDYAQGYEIAMPGPWQQ